MMCAEIIPKAVNASGTQVGPPTYPKCGQSAKTYLVSDVCFFSFALEADVANGN